MKVYQQPVYILHRKSYRESSLLVEIFSKEYGRLTLIAKGCRRKKSQIRGLFLSFKPLLVSWTGKGELPILTAIEQTGFCPHLPSEYISCGYYINELILKLLHRHDAHELLYDKYHESISRLMEGENPATILRIFEKQLLQEIGFGLVLDHDVDTGEIITANMNYQYYPQKGPVAVDSNMQNAISGTTLVALRDEKFKTHEERLQAQRLTRTLIDIQLGGRELRSRRVIREIKKFEQHFGK